MQVLVSRGTWDLVLRSTRIDIVTCRWVFAIKYKSDGMVDRYKVRLVARDFIQEYDVDYSNCSQAEFHKGHPFHCSEPVLGAQSTGCEE